MTVSDRLRRLIDTPISTTPTLDELREAWPGLWDQATGCGLSKQHDAASNPRKCPWCAIRAAIGHADALAAENAELRAAIDAARGKP